MPACTVLSHLGDATAIRLTADLADQVEVIPIPTRGELAPDLGGDVLFTLARPVDTLAEAVTRVGWVHVAGTGLDHFPLDALPDGVVLTTSRGANATAIAEWVLAVMLAFEKRLPESFVDAPYDEYERFTAPPLGTLAGRHLGLVGVGTIGRAVADRALAFAMEVRGLRRRPGPSPHPGVEAADDLAALVAWADHLVLAAPLTPQTRHLIDDRSLAAAGPGLHLVNVARGGLVDQDALRRALDDGRVARASLDTFEPEPLPTGHWLYGHPGVRLSPHRSWSEPGAYDAIFDRFAANLRRFLAGEPLADTADLAAGY